MNQELANVIRIYSTGSHQELSSYLIGKSKDTLIGILVDLLTMYINDKNSSTIREFITVTLAGYTHKEGKIGYNGFKQDSFVSGRTIKCEAKPKNFNTEEFEKYKRGERKTGPTKLNGGGNFTDYTPARLQKDKQEKDLNMLVSGFVDGKLIYIIEFPFNSPDFVKNLEIKIQKWRRKLKGSKSITGQFLRSADFDYKDYIESPKLEIKYILPKEELVKYRDYISKGFYEFLEGKAK
uniref:Restriction endonuclease n=1 Tax=candidate division WOR-3 bacterium TaxID=2052148 RepID=A0A7C6A9Y3_UNCW3